MTDKNFRDWEGATFGYGYGSGEPVIIPLLKDFLDATDDGFYRYIELENLIGKPATWFLINALCKADIIDYGTSPRYGWLTDKGKILATYMKNKSYDELLSALDRPDGEYPCYDGVCNCDTKCSNPLLKRD